MNRRRLLQTAAAALLAPAAARALPVPPVEAAPVVTAAQFEEVLALDALPRFEAGRGAIRYATPVVRLRADTRPFSEAMSGLCAPASPFYDHVEIDRG